MISNWDYSKLENNISFVIGGDWGKDPSFEDDEFTDALCIRASELRNWKNEKGKSATLRKVKKSSLLKRKLEYGDILVEISGGGPDQPVGRTVIIDNEVLQYNPQIPKICTNFFRLIRLNSNVNKHFVNYYLTYFYHSGEIVNYQGGSNNLRNLKFPEYSKINIPLPPLDQQKRIVAKLDQLFAHLDQLKARLEKIPQLLQQFRQAVLTQAVTGKLTEDWRKEHGGEWEEDISELIQIRKNDFEKNIKIFNQRKSRIRLNEFHLLKYPDKIGWLKITVESAATFIIDCLHSTPKFQSTGEYCVDTNSIEPFKINWNKVRKVSEDTYKKWTNRLEPKGGDILFSREGTIGTAVMVPENIKLCIGQRMMIFRFSTFVNPKYAEIYMNSGYFKELMRPNITGTTAAHINIKVLRKLPFTLPSTIEQNLIVKRVEYLLAKADRIESQYQSLKAKIDQLPQAILAKAFRGELV